MTYTPIPWHICPEENCDDFIEAEDGLSVTFISIERPMDEQRANAQIIVTAVNSHERYRFALQSIARMSDDKTAARIAQEALGE